MIEFEKVSFFYDNRFLLRNFSLQIASGEKIVISGGSGTGKSTLLGSIEGFVLPEEGCITVNNLPVIPENIAEIRRNIAWVPQEFSLPYDSVKEMIYAPFSLRINQHIKIGEELILNVFDRLGLEHSVYQKRQSEISGGQRQRVMIAIALLMDKEILLLDEPTSALDADSVQKVISLLQEQTGKTVVAVSHDDRFIHSFDRFINLKAEING